MNMVSKTKLVWSLVVFLASNSPSLNGQALVISPGNIDLQPDAAGQNVDIFVQNSGTPAAVTGVQLNIQVGDGGPAAGGTLGPSITAVDVITGTIFESNNNGLGGTGSVTTQIFDRATGTSSGTVNIPTSPPSKIATVTFDTTGFMEGTFALTLNTLNGPTFYTTTGPNLTPTLTDGTLTIIPEPHETAMFAGLIVFAFAILRRRFQTASVS